MFIFLDTETTGTGPDDRLCQIAYKPEVGSAISELFNPGIPISVDAMAVHHITNKMVEDKPAFKGSQAYEKLVELLSDQSNIVVAHNAKFDIGMLEKEGIQPQKVICTLKLARYLDSAGAIPRYNLQYLRYFLGIEIEAKAHDALGDITVLEALFKRIYKKFMDNGQKNITYQMMKISSEPVLIARMPFGKHKDTLFRDVPRDYLEWLSGTDLDEDLEYTVRHFLSKI